MRRILSMLLIAAALFFCGCACGEELLCVNTEEFAALLTADGEEVVAPGSYDDIFCVSPGKLYAVGSRIDGKMQYVLCDASGNVRTEIPCGMFGMSHDVVVFRRDGLYGAMDAEGRVLVPAVYTQLTASGNGGLFALATDPLDDHADEVLLIDETGEVRSTGSYTAIGLKPVQDGRMAFRSPDTEKYGYLDTEGSVVVEPQLTYAGDFENGAAVASQDGMYGVLSTMGEWMIAPKYDYIEIGEDMIFGLLGGDTCILWDAANCAERFRVTSEGIQGALLGKWCLISDGKGVSLYDRDGMMVFEAGQGALFSVGAGDQLILSDGNWGTECASVLDGRGKRLEGSYQHLIALDDARYAFMTMNVAAYDSQALGEIRYSCDYDSIRFGMLDCSGNEILPAGYLEITGVGENRYLTQALDGYRVIDGSGEVIWSRLDAGMR